MAPKYQKEPVQVFTRWRIRQKEPGPGVHTVTAPFGTGTVQKTGPTFLEVHFSDLLGNDLEQVPCEHSLTDLWEFKG